MLFWYRTNFPKLVSVISTCPVINCQESIAQESGVVPVNPIVGADLSMIMLFPLPVFHVLPALSIA